MTASVRKSKVAFHLGFKEVVGNEVYKSSKVEKHTSPHPPRAWEGNGSPGMAGPWSEWPRQEEVGPGKSAGEGL